MRKSLDTSIVNGNNERTGPRIASTRQESRIIVWDKDGNHPNLVKGSISVSEISGKRRERTPIT